jgi:transcriptional regulator with XRE-family HTH domain
MAKTRANRTPTSRQIPDLERRALGARLLERRRELGWTQRQLAARALIAYRRISRFENGRVAPNLPETIRLAGALGLSLDRLVLGQLPSLQESRSAVFPLAEIEALGTPEQCAVIGDLLRKLLLGFQVSREAQT